MDLLATNLLGAYVWTIEACHICETIEGEKNRKGSHHLLHHLLLVLIVTLHYANTKFRY